MVRPRKDRCSRRIVASVILGLSVIGADAQIKASVQPDLSPWLLALRPEATIPLFPEAESFGPAYGGSLGVEYSLSPGSGFALAGNLGYSYGTLKASVAVPNVLAEPSLKLGVAYSLPMGPIVSARFFANGGGVYGAIDNRFPEANLYAIGDAGLGLALAVGSNWALRVDAAYAYRLGLYGGLSTSAGLAWSVPAATVPTSQGPRLRLLEFGELKLGNIFPIFKSYYDEHPLGVVVVTNTSKLVAKDVRISFLMKQFMDGPKECLVLPELKPGESKEVPLLALFNNSVLDVTEATKATAEIDVEYQDPNGTQDISKTGSVRVYDRNAMTWDDDRKAAAFVTGKDPWVLELSNNITAAVKDYRSGGINKNLQTAIAFHEGLRLYGLSYVTNPKTPFSQTFSDPAIVDFLKFPRQTLSFKAGDCSDLSILYASFFESVGVESAFITVPEHIFMAANLELTPDEAKAKFSDTADLIFREGKTWLPIETTMRDSGFIEAWHEASKEWGRASTNGTAAFYPIHEAWQAFAPVGLAADSTSGGTIASDRISKAFSTELMKLVDKELAARTALFDQQIKASGSTPKLVNNRGVLFAQFGLYSKAEADFKAATSKVDYAPALINLGNISLLRTDQMGALTFYQRAAKLLPDNTKLLLGLAKVANAVGKNDVALATLARLTKLDPTLAEQNSQVILAAQSGTRAGQIGATDLPWTN